MRDAMSTDVSKSSMPEKTAGKNRELTFEPTAVHFSLFFVAFAFASIVTTWVFIPALVAASIILLEAAW
jgi:hypothetical protein